MTTGRAPTPIPQIEDDERRNTSPVSHFSMSTDAEGHEPPARIVVEVSPFGSHAEIQDEEQQSDIGQQRVPSPIIVHHASPQDIPMIPISPRPIEESSQTGTNRNANENNRLFIFGCPVTQRDLNVAVVLICTCGFIMFALLVLLLVALGLMTHNK